MFIEIGMSGEGADLGWKTRVTFKTCYYGLNVCVYPHPPAPNLYVEAQTPSAIVFGGGAFGMWLI